MWLLNIMADGLHATLVLNGWLGMQVDIGWTRGRHILVMYDSSCSPGRMVRHGIHGTNAVYMSCSCHAITLRIHYAEPPRMT